MGLEVHRRHLPHFTLEGSYYFVTFRLLASPLTLQEAILIRDHIRGCPNAHIFAAIVMPDHVHLILTLHGGKTLSSTIGRIKGSSARRLNLLRRRRGVVLQRESFDRIIRSEVELDEKLKYMLMNSVEAGLTTDPWGYPGWYLNEDPMQ